MKSIVRLFYLLFIVKPDHSPFAHKDQWKAWQLRDKLKVAGVLLFITAYGWVFFKAMKW